MQLSIFCSMGGSTGLLFSSTYPDVVDKLATLDIIKPVILPLPWHEQSIKEAIELFLDMEKKLADPRNQKGLPLEVLVSRYVDANKGEITVESVRTLMARGSKPAPSGKGFIYSHDPRIVRIRHFEICCLRILIGIVLTKLPRYCPVSCDSALCIIAKL